MSGRSIALPPGALDRLMPMHLIVARDGTIRHAAPTLAKLRAEEALPGRPLFDVLDLKRPRGVATVADLAATAGSKLHFQFRHGRPTPLKGAVATLDPGGLILNLSFGLGVIDGVRDYRLTCTDFAPTDLAVEMLYLTEAKFAAMQETRNLITRLQAAKVAAEEQAFTDTLTGVKNRRALDHILRRVVEEGGRFAILHLDLDWFKCVNDTFGHAAGDHVLQQIARMLVEETREQDVVARVGGDEFVLVLAELTDADRLAALAARIIERISRPILYQGQRCSVSASVGLTRSDIYDHPDLERMHADADAALYASKRRGRGCYTIATEAVLREAPLREPPSERRQGAVA